MLLDPRSSKLMTGTDDEAWPTSQHAQQDTQHSAQTLHELQQQPAQHAVPVPTVSCGSQSIGGVACDEVDVSCAHQGIMPRHVANKISNSESSSEEEDLLHGPQLHSGEFVWSGEPPD